MGVAWRPACPTGPARDAVSSLRLQRGQCPPLKETGSFLLLLGGSFHVSQRQPLTRKGLPIPPSCGHVATCASRTVPPCPAPPPSPGPWWIGLCGPLRQQHQDPGWPVWTLASRSPLDVQQPEYSYFLFKTNLEFSLSKGPLITKKRPRQELIDRPAWPLLRNKLAIGGATYKGKRQGRVIYELLGKRTGICSHAGKNTCQTPGGRKRRRRLTITLFKKSLKSNVSYNLGKHLFFKPPLNLADEETGLFLPRQRHEFVNRQPSPRSCHSDRGGLGEEGRLSGPDSVPACPQQDPGPRQQPQPLTLIRPRAAR